MATVGMAFVAALVCAVGSPSHAAGQQGRREVEEGNRLYGEGRYQEAHARYLDALRLAPDVPLIRFNEGNALYQSEELERALQAYAEVAQSGDERLEAQAWYNVGNALARSGQLPEALEAYKATLRRTPGDIDAKHNLELVLQQLEQDQNQDQDQDQQDQDEDDQDRQDQEQGGSEGGDENRENPQDDQGQGEDPRNQGGQPDEPQDPGEPDPQEGEGSEGGDRPLPPGQMSREEAERLLGAVQEDPDEVDRQAGQPRGRRPLKDW